jgi:hypothetical protein
MKITAVRTVLALVLTLTTFGATRIFAQQTPAPVPTSPMQPDGNPGGGNTDPCGDNPCLVAIH